MKNTSTATADLIDKLLTGAEKFLVSLRDQRDQILKVETETETRII